jgi:hypothetical protein
MEPQEILVVAVIGAAVSCTLFMISFTSVQRRLDMDRRSFTMSIMFCASEVFLVVPVILKLPYNAFVVMHQLLLAYPGNIVFKIVATIVSPPHDSDKQPLPNQRSMFQQELKFLKELKGMQKQILAELKRTDELLDKFKKSLSKCQLHDTLLASIHNIEVKTKDLQVEVKSLSECLTRKKDSVGSRRDHLNKNIGKL